ncbi:MAG: glycoside hydrolase family 2 TIM barrel-domain containing protein, partial [Chitinophaga rupis]
MKRSLALLSVFTCLAGFSASANDTTGIIRMISFTSLHSLKLEVVFSEPPVSGAQFGLKITDGQGAPVADGIIQPDGPLKEDNKLIFHINDLSVEPWTPTHPRLYQLQLTVTQPGRASLVRTQRIGFRTFESKNGNLYLNGKPIFLRGIAINPPGRGIPDTIERSRKFAEDYVRFMKSIHVNIIRIPNDDTWYDVCDENGMMVFGGNYSGSVNGGKPPKDYNKAIAWYENKAFAMIAHHPSLMIYALTNETPFQGKLADEWEKFLSYAAAQIKQWDSTRVTIANAGYGYGKAGDICDLHRYWGWYYSSPFTFLHVRNNEDIIPFPKKVQPVTFTECVGN